MRMAGAAVAAGREMASLESDGQGDGKLLTMDARTGNVDEIGQSEAIAWTASAANRRESFPGSLTCRAEVGQAKAAGEAGRGGDAADGGEQHAQGTPTLPDGGEQHRAHDGHGHGVRVGGGGLRCCFTTAQGAACRRLPCPPTPCPRGTSLIRNCHTGVPRS